MPSCHPAFLLVGAEGEAGVEQWVWAAAEMFCRIPPDAGPAWGLRDTAEQAEGAGLRCFLND